MTVHPCPANYNGSTLDYLIRSELTNSLTAILFSKFSFFSSSSSSPKTDQRFLIVVTYNYLDPSHTLERICCSLEANKFILRGCAVMAKLRL